MKKIYTVDKPFVEGLNDNILLIAKHSFHTMFFMKQLWHELNKKCDIEGLLLDGMFPEHELCNLPIDQKEFKLFPWNFNSFDAVVGDTELDLLSEQLSDGKEIASFYENKTQINSSKSNFIITKILRMTDDLANKLHGISVKNDIPYVSIIDLTKIITSGGDLKKIRKYEKSPDNFPVSDKIHNNLSELILNIAPFKTDLEQEKAILSNFSILPKILLPKDLSNDSQKKIISKLSNQIYNLLIESFWVLLTIDWIEYCRLLFYIKNNNP
ncbi:MAG: hypothetical protein KKF12_14790, partial [Proteobacteria bacterium]|nr:hypothetical protein [Desulfobacula sp.]MBU4132080.1 hypothetical protein [Pseudomonadota bacterium]